MATWKYKSGAYGTLASNYTAGDGTLALTAGHGARFSSSGDFWVKIGTADDSPIRKCTSRSTDTLTFTGGAQANTSDANVTAPVTVSEVVCEPSVNQLRSDLVLTGADATIVAAGEKDGQIMLPTDGYYLRRYSGS